MEIDDIYPVKLPNISIFEVERKEKLDLFFIIIPSSEGSIYISSDFIFKNNNKNNLKILSLTLIEYC